MLSFKFKNKPSLFKINFINPKEGVKNKKNLELIEIFRQNRPYTYLKNDYTQVVPLKVYMTWGTKLLPPKMKKNFEKLQRENPAFEFIIYDDKDCEKFLIENFDGEVLWAFNKLVPGAYKADLWRLCILYKYGGFYLDIKENCLNGFKLIELCESEHFVLDRPPNHILNALMVCKAGNKFLEKCIEEIVKNAKTNYYGPSCLWPTGPGLLGKVALENNFKLNIDLILPQHGEFILYRGVAIMKGYDGYQEERRNFGKTEHYGKLCENKKN
jgi:mannosyltransferase OCH1-like enzyme